MGRNKERIEEIRKELESLPHGGVTVRRRNGQVYHYHRWTENHVAHDEYVPSGRVSYLLAEMERKKELKEELKRLEGGEGEERQERDEHAFRTHVRRGEALGMYASPVGKYRKRFAFGKLMEYLEGEVEKVFILYGLRRTGKTTMIRQAILELGNGEKDRTAFIQIAKSNTISDLYEDLRYLEKTGYRYVFIDEVTLLDDFVEGAALLPDIFVSSGMRIVLSGTDSLSFLFSADGELYDRAVFLHTTHIPYREFSKVLGRSGIDEYIRYGGTMSISGEMYGDESVFATKKKADEYVESAIARNIQHSLRCYQDGGHFGSLQRLFEKNELTNVINRIVENINHQITLDVLTRPFRSGALAINNRNLLKDRKAPRDILSKIDERKVTERLKTLLEILDEEERKVVIDEDVVSEVKEYLILLDLLHTVDVERLPYTKGKTERMVISQPGMRYAQAGALVESLMEDERFEEMDVFERNYVKARIFSEMEGRMLEDIVLLETKLANPGKRVFVLQFPVGEFDMVVADPVSMSCVIYEVKHSATITPEQRCHLLDKEKTELTEHRYGKITRRCVLYRGAPGIVDDVEYMNVEDYLEKLGEKS